jgi:CubicO group peptidase (beta-lactamase class C family)
MDVHRLMSEANLPGIAKALVQESSIGVETYGVRNAVSGAPIGSRTVFAAASLSKPVFAYLVLQLLDQGRLSLDDAVSTYAPTDVNGDPRGDVITVRNILCHTAGLPNWRSKDWPLRTFFRPGERFSYSGEGFVWLQHAVEAITGEELDVVAHRLVFDPLGMTESSFVWQPSFEGDYADPHDGLGAPIPQFRPTEANAAASLHTTVIDYARFLVAVLGGKRLRPKTAAMWLSPQVTLLRHGVFCLDERPAGDSVGIAWGLGWGLETEPDTFFQWGDNGGFKAMAMGSQRTGEAVVVLTNGAAGLWPAMALSGEHFPGKHPSFDWLD